MKNCNKIGGNQKKTWMMVCIDDFGAIFNEKTAEHITNLGLWISDDIVYDFQCLEYTFKWRNVYFSHSYKVWGNSMGIESSKMLDLKSPHVCHSAVVISIKILSFRQLIRDREKVNTIDSNMNNWHWHLPMRKQLRKARGMLKATCQPFPSTTWMHQKYLYEKNISMSNIYRT